MQGERSLEGGIGARLKDLSKGAWPGAWKKLVIKQWSKPLPHHLLPGYL